MFSASMLGLGGTVGSILGVIVMKYEAPKVGFLISCIVAGFLLIFGFVTDDALENNEYAKD